MEENSSLLVVSFGSLSYHLWISAALRAIRTHCPTVKFLILTDSLGIEVFSGNPNVAHMINVKNWTAIFKLPAFVYQMKKKGCSCLLSFYPLKPVVHKIFSWMDIGRVVQGKIDSLVDGFKLIENLGIKCFDAQMELFFTNPLENVNHNSFPMIGISPRSPISFHQWAHSHFIELSRHLQMHTGGEIVLLDKHNDHWMRTIADQIENSRLITHHFSVQKFTETLRGLSLFITSSLDEFYLACTLKIPVLAILGHTDIQKLNPYLFHYEGMVFLQPQTCLPCTQKKCNYSLCMETLDVSRVFEAALKFLYTEHNTKFELQKNWAVF